VWSLATKELPTPAAALINGEITVCLAAVNRADQFFKLWQGVAGSDQREGPDFRTLGHRFALTQPPEINN
jgi:hypothetical protein